MKKKSIKKIIIIIIIILGLIFIMPNLILKNTSSEKILQSKIRSKYLNNEYYSLIDLIEYATSDVDDIEIIAQKDYNYCIEGENYAVNIAIANNGDENGEYKLEWGIGNELQEKTIKVDSVENIQFEFENEGKNQCKIILKKDDNAIEEWERDIYYIKKYQPQFGEELANQYICVHFIDNLWADIDRLDLLNAIGIKGVRADIILTIIYANNNENYERFDSWINKILNSGLEIQALLNTDPNSISQLFGEDGKVSNETELQNIIDMSEKIATRYSKITEFEILNEPNNYYKTDEDMVWYGKMVNGIAERLKNINSDVNIIYGSTSLGTDARDSKDFLRQVAINGAYDYADEFSTHIYDYSINGDNKIMNDNLYNHREIIRDLGGFQNIDITEFGLPEREGIANEEQQADSVIQQLCIQNSYDVKNTSYYSFRDLQTGSTTNSDVSGIVRDDYTPKLLYYALKTYYENTNGAEYIGTVNLAEGLEAHVYDKDGKPKIVTWSKDTGTNVNIDYTGFTAKDLYGNDIANTNGKLEVTTSPIYLDNISTNYFYQAISNTALEKYAEFEEKFATEIAEIEGLQGKIDELKQYMQSISSVNSVTEAVAKQRMEEHFNLGNLILEAYENGNLDIEHVRLSSMLDMLNDVGNSFEDLVTVSSTTRNTNLQETKTLIDTVELDLKNNSDIEIIYPNKILEFSKDLYEESEYINSLSQENDIKAGLIASKDLHAKYLANWAQIFTNIYIDEYIKNNPVTVSYSETNLTNKDVVVTINASDINVTNNEGENTYTFTENGTFTFEYIRRGRNQEIEAKVNNIDKKTPEISNLKDRQILFESIVLNISDENLETITLKKDGQVITYAQGEKIQDKALYELTVTDKANNETKVTFRIADKPEYNYNIKENNILGIKVKTTKAQFTKNYVTIEDYKIYHNDTELKDDDVVSTGDIVKLSNGNTYTIIVAGDINKDGKVTAYDLSMLRNYILRISELNSIEMLAADANCDEKTVGASDYSRIREIILGIE